MIAGRVSEFLIGVQLLRRVVDIAKHFRWLEPKLLGRGCRTKSLGCLAESFSRKVTLPGLVFLSILDGPIEKQCLPYQLHNIFLMTQMDFSRPHSIRIDHIL